MHGMGPDASVLIAAYGYGIEVAAGDGDGRGPLETGVGVCVFGAVTDGWLP